MCLMSQGTIQPGGRQWAGMVVKEQLDRLLLDGQLSIDTKVHNTDCRVFKV